MLEKIKFLNKYHIKEDKFNSINLSWEDLKDIYIDYNDNVKNDAEDVIDNVVKKLRKSNDIHSIRARVKDSEHLIEKIIRKKIKNPERVIDIENYKNEITDIIGIRMICLFKTNIKQIDTYIKKLPYGIKGKIEVNLREGDNDKFYKGIGDCKFHPAGYRSVHYNIEACDSSGEKYICEVQLRTIFEEAWGEIDHTIRYPYLQDNLYLNDYFRALNRLSGLADEMANFSEDLVELIGKAKKSEEIEGLKEELRKIKKESKEKDKTISDQKALLWAGGTAALIKLCSEPKTTVCCQCGSNNLEKNKYCSDCGFILH